MSAEYRMPPIERGDPVLWYPGANRSLTPWIGFVSVVNAGNIQAHLISPESYNFVIRDGVRHVTDPNLATNPHSREDGGWDYHPLHLWRAKIDAQIAELMKLVS